MQDLSVSNIFDIFHYTLGAFGMQDEFVPPTVPFRAPPAHRWVSVELNGVPTPALFRLGETARNLNKREQDVFRRLYIFYLDCMDLNKDSMRRRAAGDGPSEQWRDLMKAVGHDTENQDHLWYTKRNWEIRFHPRCWLVAGDDVEEKRWWEGPYAKY